MSVVNIKDYEDMTGLHNTCVSGIIIIQVSVPIELWLSNYWIEFFFCGLYPKFGACTCSLGSECVPALCWGLVLSIEKRLPIVVRVGFRIADADRDVNIFLLDASFACCAELVEEPDTLRENLVPDSISPTVTSSVCVPISCVTSIHVIWGDVRDARLWITLDEDALQHVYFLRKFTHCEKSVMENNINAASGISTRKLVNATANQIVEFVLLSI